MSPGRSKLRGDFACRLAGRPRRCRGWVRNLCEHVRAHEAKQARVCSSPRHPSPQVPRTNGPRGQAVPLGDGRGRQAHPGRARTGLESDLVLADEADDRIFDLELRPTMNHQLASDLTIAVSAVSRDGKEILKTQVLWDGPAMSRGKSVAEVGQLVVRMDWHPKASF